MSNITPGIPIQTQTKEAMRTLAELVAKTQQNMPLGHPEVKGNKNVIPPDHDSDYRGDRHGKDFDEDI